MNYSSSAVGGAGCHLIVCSSATVDLEATPLGATTGGYWRTGSPGIPAYCLKTALCVASSALGRKRKALKSIFGWKKLITCFSRKPQTGFYPNSSQIHPLSLLNYSRDGELFNSDKSFLLLNSLHFPHFHSADVILKVWEFPACFFKSFHGNSPCWWHICQLENRGTINTLLGCMFSTFV